VWKSSRQVWAKLHEEAFRYFGGCPQYVVLDNLTEGVIKSDIYEPELNAVYAAMLAHYAVVNHFEIWLARYLLFSIGILKLLII
jgi:transposase